MVEHPKDLSLRMVVLDRGSSRATEDGGPSKGCCRVAEEGGPVGARSIGVEMYCCR